MMDLSSDEAVLLSAAVRGDRDALGRLYERYRNRLRRMIELRMDLRLRGRVDPSDVLQEAFIDMSKKIANFKKQEEIPLYIWMRMIAGERLLRVHRCHLDAKKRDLRRELSAAFNSVPETPSLTLVSMLAGFFTSVGHQAIRREMRSKLRETLDQMDEMDREIIVLRHFEEMCNNEIACLLQLTKSAASNRYLRAIKKLKSRLEAIPGFSFD